MKGFLLNAHWDEESSHRLKIFGSNEDGAFLLRYNDQDPVFFAPQSAHSVAKELIAREKDVGLVTMEGEPVKAVYFKTLNGLYEGRDRFSKAGIRTYENDVRPENRFLMERFICGPVEFEGPSHKKDGLTVYDCPQIRPSSYKPQWKALSLDIETGMDGTLYSVGLSMFRGEELLKEKVFMLSHEDRNEDDLLEYSSREKTLLEKTVEAIRSWDPDLILGWHVVGFDLRFLADKASRLGVELRLGRDGSKLELQEKGPLTYATVRGREVLDGPPLLRSNFFSFTNMKLDTVAHEVLGTGKDINESGAEKVKEIERRFREDKKSLAYYNIEDCRLVHKIFLKLDIYNLLYTRCSLSGMSIDKIGYSTGAFDHYYLPRLHRKGIVAPNITDMARDEHVAGGMVIEPKVGLHTRVAVFDFKSLYPSIIRTFFIDPYSRIKASEAPQSNPANILFSKGEHILPGYLEELGAKRSNAKKNGNLPLSQAIKILMNSFYGVMGSPKSRFYHSDLPTAITTSGHWILEQSIGFFDNLGLKVIYGDTDSLFVPLSSDYADQDSANKLAQDLNYYLSRTIQDQYGCESKLEVEMEKIYDKLFFSAARGSEHGAKKRYVGWRDREMDFVGMEYVRSDWTQLAKDFQYGLFQRLFEGEPLDFYIKDEIKKLESGIYDDKLIYRKKLSKKVEEYTKSQPPHVKAALLLAPEKRKRLRSVKYLFTTSGPRPVGLDDAAKPDYQHYIEKQIRPVAQSVLGSQGLSFDEIYVGNQLSFF